MANLNIKEIVEWMIEEAKNKAFDSMMKEKSLKSSE